MSTENIQKKSCFLCSFSIVKFKFECWLRNSIPPERLSQTDVFVNFHLTHFYLTEELKSRDDESSSRSNLSYLVNSYYTTTNRQEQFWKNKESSKNWEIIRTLSYYVQFRQWCDNNGQNYVQIRNVWITKQLK